MPEIESPLIDTDERDIARKRVSRLFKFVAALYEQRNPVTRQMVDHEWLLRFENVPHHDAISLLRKFENESGEKEGEVDTETHAILRCARPTLTGPPTPPEILGEWMTPEWDDCRAKPLLTLSKNLKSENGGTVVVSFESDPFRIAALDEYRDLWNVWAANERVSLSASEVFEKLYALHGKMQRDSERYELVVSDGILCWGRLGVGVRHPLLNRPVRLIFDP